MCLGPVGIQQRDFAVTRRGRNNLFLEHASLFCVGSAPGRVEGAVSTDVSGVGPLPVFFNIGGRTSVKGTFFPIVVE